MGSENRDNRRHRCISPNSPFAIDPSLGSDQLDPFKNFFTLKESFLAPQSHRGFNEDHADNGPVVEINLFYVSHQVN